MGSLVLLAPREFLCCPRWPQVTFLLGCQSANSVFGYPFGKEGIEGTQEKDLIIVEFFPEAKPAGLVEPRCVCVCLFDLRVGSIWNHISGIYRFYLDLEMTMTLK